MFNISIFKPKSKHYNCYTLILSGHISSQYCKHRRYGGSEEDALTAVLEEKVWDLAASP